MDEHDAASASTATVTLAGELDAGSDEWRTELDNAMRARLPRIVLDLRDVVFVDSSVVRELLLLLRRLPTGGWIRLVYTHHVIRRVFEICGVVDLFPSYPDVASAEHGRTAEMSGSSSIDRGNTEAERSAASGERPRPTVADVPGDADSEGYRA